MMKGYLAGILADFALAWRLLTVIPLPFPAEDFTRPAGPAAAYFPLVGLVLGLVLAGADWLLALALPQGVAATLLLVVWVGLTGMLHLDGFMDACDGLLPPRDPDRRLEIMKDSRVGAFGVVATGQPRFGYGVADCFRFYRDHRPADDGRRLAGNDVVSPVGAGPYPRPDRRYLRGDL
jgi:cobalamin synthase